MYSNRIDVDLSYKFTGYKLVHHASALLALLEFRATICRHNKLPIIFSFHISVIDFSGPDDIALAGHQINRVSIAMPPSPSPSAVSLTHYAAGAN